MFNKKLRVVTTGDRDSFSEGLGINDKRFDEILKICKKAVMAGSNKSEAIKDAVEALNTTDVNEVVLASCIIAEIIMDIRRDSDPKTMSRDVKDRLAELGVSPEDFNKMKKANEEDMPEDLKKANEEIHDLAEDDELLSDPDMFKARIESVFKKYGIKAEVSTSRGGVSIAVDRRQFGEGTFDSIDQALDVLREAEAKGDKETVKKVSDYLKKSGGEA